MERWGTAVKLFLATVLLTGLAELNGDSIYTRRYVGSVGDPERSISSPQFPMQTFDTTVQHYVISVNAGWPEPAYIRIIASDFFLANPSFLKIYDSHDMSGTLTLWGFNERPVYQSLSQSVDIVFKPAYSMDSRGSSFRLKYSIVTETRATWAASAAFPTTGYCGDIRDSMDFSTMVTTGVLSPHSYHYDCVWIIPRTWESKHLELRINTRSWFEDGELQVYSGENSEGPRLPNEMSSMQQGLYDTVALSFTDVAFYIRLNRTMREDDVLSMVYSPNGAQTSEIMRNLTPMSSVSGCPHKNCPHCVLYWERCVSSQPASCDTDTGSMILEVTTCEPGDSAAGCFRESLERCDGFSDCPDSQDEVGCPGYETTPTPHEDEDEMSWYSYAAVPVVMVIVSLFLWRARRGLELCRDCLRGCLAHCRQCLRCRNQPTQSQPETSDANISRTSSGRTLHAHVSASVTEISYIDISLTLPNQSSDTSAPPPSYDVVVTPQNASDTGRHGNSLVLTPLPPGLTSPPAYQEYVSERERSYTNDDVMPPPPSYDSVITQSTV